MPRPLSPLKDARHSINVRMPGRLQKHLEQISTREGNSLSSTIRRLVVVALRHERDPFIVAEDEATSVLR